MGERTNVCMIDENGKLYFYSHSLPADELVSRVKAALIKGKSRWTDGQYLARIIFQSVIGDDNSTIGFGLSTTLLDGDETITVDVPKRKVKIGAGPSMEFQTFINEEE